MNASHLTPFVVLALALLSCKAADNDRPGPSPSAEPVIASASNLQPSPASVLDSMDKRTSVPLLPMMAQHQKQNMRDHLSVVQEIASALAVRDFDPVRGAAARIGFSEQMGQMCEHMGAGAPGFTALALEFHHAADRIADAAKLKNSEAVLEALDTTLRRCTSCHRTYKQQLVDEPTWVALTKSAAPHGAGPD